MDVNSKNSGRLWGIRDAALSRGMHGVVNGLSSVMLFPHRPTTRNTDVVPRGGGDDVKLHQVESFLWLYGCQARKLINEAVGTFLALQQTVGEAGGDNCRPVLVKKCREYRSMIQACAGDMSEQGDTEEVRSIGQMLYKMELILSLIEIIFVDTRPGGVIMSQLVSWIRLHFTQCTDKRRLVMESDNPADHPQYWEAVYGLVLQGRMDEARQMLSHHPSSATDPFLSMDELLRKMPVFHSYGGVSEGEFTLRWQHWQNECDRRLQDAQFSTCHQLQTICQILCGDESTVNSLKDLVDTWYHLMVSRLLFTCPTVKLFRLHAAAQDAIAAMGGRTRTTALDHVLLAAMEVDAHQVIKECQQVLDNSWFTAHITDLLYHTLGHSSEQKFLPELREYLLLDYASMLATHHSLWQVGLLYLDHCGSQGLAVAQAVLQRVPLTDDSRAMKVIQMAADRDFDNVVVGVCRVMGRRALAVGRLGAAIWWGVRSRDAAFTSHLAHKILHKYVAEGKFESSPLLDHLGPAMLLSDTLTFLGKYREFHTLYQDGKFQNAATLLVSLISSKLAPEYFWPVLLLDALPLLKSDEGVITAEQTYELMYCLNNLSHAANNKSSKGPFETEAANTAFLEKEKDIRLALSHNLARAVISEGSVQD